MPKVVVQSKVTKQTSNIETLAQQGSVMELVDKLLAELQNNAHSTATIIATSSTLEVQYRGTDTVAHTVTLPKTLHAAVVARIKQLAHLSENEHSQIQHGRIHMPNGTWLTVTTAPVFDGEQVTLQKPIATATNLSLADIALSDQERKTLDQMLANTSGLVIVAAPAGTNKTNLLYAIIREIDPHQHNISTLEEVIEQQLPGVNQMQLDAAHDLTASTGMRALLRQDADVIAINELRDGPTAQMAVHAAHSGSLVILALSSPSSDAALSWLRHSGVDGHLLDITPTLVLQSPAH